MNLSRIFRPVLSLLLIGALTAPSQAGVFDALADFQKPDMKVGQLELHPYYTFTETYDSNIFLQPRSNVLGNNANNNTAGPVLGSWIHSNNVGLKTKLPISEMHTLALNYDMVYKAYSKDPRSNNTVNQAADGTYTYKGPSGVTGHLFDRYLNTVDPASSELTARERRWQNTGGLDAEYGPEGGNLFVSVDGNQTTHKYVANDLVTRALLNRYEQTFGGRVGWKLQPKTRVYAGYHRELIHYTVHQAAPKNNKNHIFDLGIEGDIAPTLTGRIQTGYVNRKYDVPPQTGFGRYENLWSVATAVTYKPLERTSVDLLLSRSIQEATFANNQFYVSSVASLGVKHKLPWKLTAGVNGSVEFDKYPQASTVGAITASRRDDLYQTGASLDYDIQEWLKTGVAYLYRTRFSHQFSDQFDYRDHLTSWSLSVLF